MVPNGSDKRYYSYQESKDMLLDSIKVADFLEMRIKEVKEMISESKRLLESGNENESEKLEYEYGDYSEHLKFDKIEKFIEFLRERNGYFKFGSIWNILRYIWPVKLTEYGEREDEEKKEKKIKKSFTKVKKKKNTSKNNGIEEIEDGESDVKVFTIRKEEMDFYITFDFLDWEIWIHREKLF